MWIGIVMSGDGHVDATIRFEGDRIRDEVVDEMGAFFRKYFVVGFDTYYVTWADTLEEASNEIDEAINEEQQDQAELKRRNDGQEA